MTFMSSTPRVEEISLKIWVQDYEILAQSSTCKLYLSRDQIPFSPDPFLPGSVRVASHISSEESVSTPPDRRDHGKEDYISCRNIFCRSPLKKLPVRPMYTLLGSTRSQVSNTLKTWGHACVRRLKILSQDVLSSLPFVSTARPKFKIHASSIHPNP